MPVVDMPELALSMERARILAAMVAPHWQLERWLSVTSGAGDVIGWTAEQAAGWTVRHGTPRYVWFGAWGDMTEVDHPSRRSAREALEGRHAMFERSVADRLLRHGPVDCAVCAGQHVAVMAKVSGIGPVDPHPAAAPDNEFVRSMIRDVHRRRYGVS